MPGARIDWVVEEAFSAIPAMHPAVRRVIPIGIRRWRNALWSPSVWREIAAFRRALALERYDAVIDTQSLLKSALVTTLTNGRSHGLDRASAREPLAARFYDTAHNVPKNLHAVERNRQLTALALNYPVENPLEYGLRAHGTLESAPFAVFLTMTSRADKLWPESQWIDLGRALGVPAVLPWGSEAERARAERIAAAIGHATVPARMGFTELAKLFADANAVVGLDSGLTHLAAALGGRTVGIYCGSDPELTGLYGSSNAVNLGAVNRPPSVAEVLRALR
jgi:heptosyltransferase-1